jgi:hypothetical protein
MNAQERKEWEYRGCKQGSGNLGDVRRRSERRCCLLCAVKKDIYQVLLKYCEGRKWREFPCSKLLKINEGIACK